MEGPQGDRGWQGAIEEEWGRKGCGVDRLCDEERRRCTWVCRGLHSKARATISAGPVQNANGSPQGGWEVLISDRCRRNFICHYVQPLFPRWRNAWDTGLARALFATVASRGNLAVNETALPVPRQGGQPGLADRRPHASPQTCLERCPWCSCQGRQRASARVTPPVEGRDCLWRTFRHPHASQPPPRGPL